MSEQVAKDIVKLVKGHKAERDGFVRVEVDAKDWVALGHGFTKGLQDFSGLWVDGKRVRMALISRDRNVRAICTLGCVDNAYPSIGAIHPPALRLERAMADLYGTTATGTPDDRPWLDHGFWPKEKTKDRGGKADKKAKKKKEKFPYQFLPNEGEGLHQIPVGPVHAGIIEPGHFRFTCNGEAVVRLEQWLGFQHKGIEALCVGKSIEDAARIIGRVSGDSTVAYAFAFARCVEAIYGVEVPVRAQMLRAVMAELERISHHVSDFGAICNDASVVTMNAHCTRLRETVLQVADRCFGHRMMMDKIVPGGVSVDLDEQGADDIREVLGDLARDFRTALKVYDGSPSLLDRTVTTGFVKKEYAAMFGAGGHVGRASGRDFDCRRDVAYAPYDTVAFEVPVREDGDVNARALIRAFEVTQSIAIIVQLLERLEPGPIRAKFKAKSSGEGAAMAEAFRGDVFITLSLDEKGSVSHCHARDASWFQWPLLENAVEGNIVADFPLCNKSFNCSYSGHDI